MPALMRKSESPVDSVQLLADFQTALMQRAMTESAEAEAAFSEKVAITTITDYSAQANGVYIAPGDIPKMSLDAIGRASVDAHLKKAQTSQLKAYTSSQLQQLQASAAHTYIRRRVRITITDPEAQPVEGVWRDSRTGRERSNIIRQKQIKGTITDLALDRNAFIVTPSALTRVFNGNVSHYFVYPIDPHTLAPAIAVTFL